LPAFEQRHPQIGVDLRQFESDEPTAGLRDATVDVAFVRLPFNRTGLLCEPLLTDQRVAALAVDYPLAHRNTLTFSELAEEPVIVPDADNQA